jgi:hypothetical protein
MSASTIRTLSARIAVVMLTAASLALAGCSEMLSREDFAAKVKDKSDKEVAKQIGKPASVAEVAPDQVAWTYNERTFNIEQGNKFDSKTVVVFNKGAADGQLRAVDVKFE